jgi:hypothetical protein
MSLEVAGQYAFEDDSKDLSTYHTFSFDPPTIQRITVKDAGVDYVYTETAEESNWTSIDLHGINFGDNSLSNRHYVTLFSTKLNTTYANCTFSINVQNHIKASANLCVDLTSEYGVDVSFEVYGQEHTFLAPTISSMKISTGSDEETVADQPRTQGGAILEITGDHFDDASIRVTIGGKRCLVTDTFSNHTVRCTVPEGQGADQHVVVTAGVLRSLPSPLSYLPPSVDWTNTYRNAGLDTEAPFARGPVTGAWDDCSSLGEELTLKGDNFGLSADGSISGIMIGKYLCGPDVNSTISPCSVKVINHQTLNISIPGGEGFGHDLRVIVSGQPSKMYKYKYHKPIPIDWKDVTVNITNRADSRRLGTTILEAFTNPTSPTEGGSEVIVIGRNFGSLDCAGPGCNTSTPERLSHVIQIDGRNCILTSWARMPKSTITYHEDDEDKHIDIVKCKAPQGQGKGLALSIWTGGQANTDLRFSYIAPNITNVCNEHIPPAPYTEEYSVTTLEGAFANETVVTRYNRTVYPIGWNVTVCSLTASTSGGQVVTMTGSNFGLEGMVVVGDATQPPFISSTITPTKHTHTEIVFAIPMDHGFGGGRKISVVQGGIGVADINGQVQNHSLPFYYMKPIITRAYVGSSNPDMPTEGRDADNNPVELTITGESFGQSYEFTKSNGDVITQYPATIRIFVNDPIECSSKATTGCDSYLRQPEITQLYENGVFKAECPYETSSKETMCSICPVIRQTQNQIICNPGPGVGGPLTVMIETRPNLNYLPNKLVAPKCDEWEGKADISACDAADKTMHAECAITNPPHWDFEGDFAEGSQNLPTIKGHICSQSLVSGTISYRAPILREFMPTRYIDATGRDGRGTPIEIKISGENFGNKRSNAIVFFDKMECTDAQWQDPYQVVDGIYQLKDPSIDAPFITCTSPENQFVGWKTITLKVALQTVTYLPNCTQEIEVLNATSGKYIKVISTACGNKLRAECKEGYFGADGETCHQCDQGMVCDIANIATPDSKNGWWEFAVNPADPDYSSKCDATLQDTRATLPCTGTENFDGTANPSGCKKGEGCPYYVPCEPFEACVGENVCEEKYTGPRCTLCAKGYFKLSGVCTPCPSCHTCLILFLLLALVMGTVACWFLVKKRVNIGVLSIGVDYFQVIAVLAMSNKVHWPTTMKTILQYLSVFSFNLDLVAPECMVDPEFFKYEYKWYFIEGMPLIACTTFMIFHFYIYCKKKFIQGRTKHLHNHAHLGIGNGLVTFYLLYLYITKTSLDIFNCSPTTPPDGHEYLEVVFEECDIPGGLHMRLLPAAIMTFMLYSLGFPALVAFIVFKNRNRCIADQILRAEQSVRRPAEEQRKQELKDARVWNFRKRFSTLYYQYKPDFFYWKLVILARKFCVATAGLLFRRYPVFLLAFSLLILFASYALQVRNQPYMSNVEMQEVAEKNRVALKAIQKYEAANKKIVRSAEKKLKNKFNLAKDQDLEEHNKQKAKGALEFLWNYNTVEATLLCCAVLIMLFGLMFQDQESVTEGSNEETGLFIVTMSVMIFSIVYFSTVAFSEIYIGLGHECNCVKRLMQHNPGRGRLGRSGTSQTDSEEINHTLSDNIDNPLAHRREDHQANPMHGASLDTVQMEAQEQTIKAQQEEIMRLKKENQAKMLSSFGSSKANLKKKGKGGSKRAGNKKTFAAGNNASKPDEGDTVVMRSASSAEAPDETML